MISRNPHGIQHTLYREFRNSLSSAIMRCDFIQRFSSLGYCWLCQLVVGSHSSITHERLHFLYMPLIFLGNSHFFTVVQEKLKSGRHLEDGAPSFWLVPFYCQMFSYIQIPCLPHLHYLFNYHIVNVIQLGPFLEVG